MTADAEDVKERQAALDRARQELTASQIKNAETADKAVLSLSAGFLAFSIAFIKDIAVSPYLNGYWLYASWILFSVAIVATIGSFSVGQYVLRQLIERAPDYYLLDDQDAFNYSKRGTRLLDRLNIFNGACFIAAVVCTLFFAIPNIDRKMNMTQEDKAARPRTENHSQPVNVFQPYVAPKPATKPAGTGTSTGASTTSEGSSSSSTSQEPVSK